MRRSICVREAQNVNDVNCFRTYNKNWYASYVLLQDVRFTRCFAFIEHFFSFLSKNHKHTVNMNTHIMKNTIRPNVE